MQDPVDQSDKVTPPVNPRTIQLARLARQVSQEELAEATGIQQGRLSKIENGLVIVHDSELAALSDSLDFPEPFFRDSISEHGTVSDVFHRKKVSSSARLVKSITARLNIQSHRIGKLLECVSVQPKRQLRTIDPDEVDSDIEDIAQEVRRVWAVPPGPILDITRLVESAGVIVFKIPLEHQSISGVSHWAENSVPLMLVNATMPPDRLRWTLAHELGHLVLHSGTYRVGKDIEQEADRFASAFLLPDQDILHDLHGGIGLDRLAALKNQWRVSMSAIARKALDLGVITKSQRTWLMVQLTRRGWRMREPVSFSPEHPELASRMLRAYLDVPGVSCVEVRATLRISARDLELWFGRSGSGELRLL